MLFLYCVKDYIWFTNTNWMEALTSWFSLALTKRRLRPPFFYQHILDGSTNSLLYRHRLEGSSDSLPCATIPPCNINQFIICFSCSISVFNVSAHSHSTTSDFDSVLPQTPLRVDTLQTNTPQANTL
jgi:hypothetical protein